MAIAKITCKKSTAHRRYQQTKHSYPAPLPQRKHDKLADALEQYREETKIQQKQQMQQLCDAFTGMLVSNPIQELADKFQTLSLREADPKQDTKMQQMQEMQQLCDRFTGMLISNPVQELADKFQTLSLRETDPIQELIDELTPSQLEFQAQHNASEMREHERYNNRKWWDYANQLLQEQHCFTIGDQTPIWF